MAMKFGFHRERENEMTREEYTNEWIEEHRIELVNVSFRNNGMFDEKSVYRPMIKRTDDYWGEKVIGVITNVNEDWVSGVMYAEIIPEINKDFVCSVELKEK